MTTELEDFEKVLLGRAIDALTHAIAEQNLPEEYMSKRLREAIQREELTIWPSSLRGDEATVALSFLTEDMDDSIDGENIGLSDLLWHWPDCWKSQAMLIAATEASILKLKERYQEHFGMSFQDAHVKMNTEDN